MWARQVCVKYERGRFHVCLSVHATILYNQTLKCLEWRWSWWVEWWAKRESVFFSPYYIKTKQLNSFPQIGNLVRQQVGRINNLMCSLTCFFFCDAPFTLVHHFELFDPLIKSSRVCMQWKGIHFYCESVSSREAFIVVPSKIENNENNANLSYLIPIFNLVPLYYWMYETKFRE